jgi:signal peptidase I
MEPPSSSNERSAATYHRAHGPFAAVSAGLAVTAALAWACLRVRPSRVRIDGASMVPTLLPGDWAVCVTSRRYRPGDVVVLEHPGRPGYEMVKRLTAGPGEFVGERRLGSNEWWVQGDHATSTDSRQFGPVLAEAVNAKVVLIYWPRERRRIIR